MTEPTRTRRGFFRLLTGEAEPAKTPGNAPENAPENAPGNAPGFSLSRFYAARKETGEATAETIPEFEVTETAAFGTTPVGTPEKSPHRPRFLGAGKRQP